MMPSKIPDDGSDEPLDTVMLIAEALTQKFGLGGLEAAKRQRDKAGDDTRATWEEVVARLAAQANHPE